MLYDVRMYVNLAKVEGFRSFVSAEDQRLMQVLDIAPRKRVLSCVSDLSRNASQIRSCLEHREEHVMDVIEHAIDIIEYAMVAIEHAMVAIDHVMDAIEQGLWMHPPINRSLPPC